MLSGQVAILVDLEVAALPLGIFLKSGPPLSWYWPTLHKNQDSVYEGLILLHDDGKAAGSRHWQWNGVSLIAVDPDKDVRMQIC